MGPIYVGVGMGSLKVGAMGMRLRYLESRVIQQSTTSMQYVEVTQFQLNLYVNMCMAI